MSNGKQSIITSYIGLVPLEIYKSLWNSSGDGKISTVSCKTTDTVKQRTEAHDE